MARADQVVAMARKHAEEIRVAAEQEAERMLAEAEREALRRQEERLEAERRERIRIGVQRQHIEDCLDATVAAVTRMRELIASLPAIEPSETRSDTPDDRTLSPVVESDRRSLDRRHRIMNGLALILGGWAIVMLVTLVAMPGEATDATLSNGGSAASTPPRTSEVVPAGRAQATAPSNPESTIPPATAERLEVTPEEPGLTVAFVAARDCWISITSDDGMPSDLILRASERYVVRAKDAVSFKAGNAGALSMLINDQPAAPLGGEGQVVARRITRSNYRSLLRS